METRARVVLSNEEVTEIHSHIRLMQRETGYITRGQLNRLIYLIFSNKYYVKLEFMKEGNKHMLHSYKSMIYEEGGSTKIFNKSFHEFREIATIDEVVESLIEHKHLILGVSELPKGNGETWKAKTYSVD